MWEGQAVRGLSKLGGHIIQQAIQLIDTCNWEKPAPTLIQDC